GSTVNLKNSNNQPAREGIMKLHRLQIVPLIVLLLALGASLTVQAQEVDVESIMAEIGELADERQANEEKIQIDLKARQGSDRDVAANKQEIAAAKADNEQAASEAAAMVSQYGGSISGGNYTVNCKKNAGCSSQIKAIDGRFKAYTALLKSQKTRRASRSGSSKNLTALRTRNRSIARRIASLRKLLAGARALKSAKKRGSCVTSCKSLASEAASQCLQRCWDGARGGAGVARAERMVKPSFSVTPRRTAEQAISEYKKSGAARPGPKTFRTRRIPVPKF
ncbi:MAG: hypothetical protein ACTSUY_11615, partial [Alphaproteobacteria bacterium]